MLALRRAQNTKNPGFHNYDWGPAGNLLHYNTTTTPSYDLTQIKSPPIALFHGGEDYLGDPTDVAWLQTQIPKETIVYVNLQADYSHMQV